MVVQAVRRTMAMGSAGAGVPRTDLRRYVMRAQAQRLAFPLQKFFLPRLELQRRSSTKAPFYALPRSPINRALRRRQAGSARSVVFYWLEVASTRASPFSRSSGARPWRGPCSPVGSGALFPGARHVQSAQTASRTEADLGAWSHLGQRDIRFASAADLVGDRPGGLDND